MGQQQLLLIILVAVVVGIMTVIAVNTMQASRDEANKEAVRLDLLKAVMPAQAYYKKPISLDGGGGSFTGIDFNDLMMDTANANGSYAIKDRSTGSFKLAGTPVSTGDEIVLVIYSDHSQWQ